ncbi:unnamed protein product, partial [Meganyctiphanes norvegica]
MITKALDLPDPDSLKVQEVTIGLPALRAGAFHCGKQCENQNNEFMLCRQEEKDPRKCIDEGKAVTSCALNFFRQIKKSCLEEFNQYANCLDKSSKDVHLKHACHRVEATCVIDLNTRSHPNKYDCKVKVFASLEPKPDVDAPLEFPDAPVSLPEVDRKEAKYGTRFHWMT